MKKRLIVVFLALLLALASYLLPIEGQAKSVLAVTVFVVFLWLSEIIPLHVTALVASFLLVIIGKLPEKEVFANFFDPAIVLLLGGFVIAVAMKKHKLDYYFTHKIVSRFGSKPSLVLLGIIVSTSFVSMWISNTAAAAIMMPLALVLLARNRMKPMKSNFGKASVLAVAYGATIGGLGTIVGSTPNIIAAKYLNNAGEVFGFFQWFYRGFPFMLLMILGGWLALLFLFRPEKKKLEHITKMRGKLKRDQKIVLGIFALTILLWMTESIHGVSSANVAIVPVILLYLTGMLGNDDFSKVDWETLILVGGGLALGYGMHKTGLDELFVAPLKGAVDFGPVTFFLILGILGVLLTSFISNTTASAIYIPLVVALASAFGVGTTNSVIVAAIGVSLDFIFPFGTPPSAIAYSTKYVRMKDMAKAGVVISLIGIVLLALIALIW